MEKLKPCPFCGGKAVFHVISNKMSHYGAGFEFNVICENCNARYPKSYEIELSLGKYGEMKTLRDDREEAVKTWNKRAGDAP